MNESAIFTLVHSKSGAKCRIHSYGATVFSYTDADGRECLFLSRDAKMDGSKAIRGGIPLVFPQFGQPDDSMPQHGFLRRNAWTQLESSKFDNDKGAGVSYQLELRDAEEARGGPWQTGESNYNCVCLFTVKINGHKIITTLEIKNIGQNAFRFQTLQHTYLLVSNRQALDPKQCYVEGLEGYSIVDKVTGKDSETCGNEPIVVNQETDRVYQPPNGKDKVEVTVGVGAGRTVRLMATGTVAESLVPVSCVVWNPFKDKAAQMSDFGDDQYVDMICVEPGILHSPSLEPGKTAQLCQEIEV